MPASTTADDAGMMEMANAVLEEVWGFPGFRGVQGSVSRLLQHAWERSVGLEAAESSPLLNAPGPGWRLRGLDTGQASGGDVLLDLPAVRWRGTRFGSLKDCCG